MKTCGKCKTTKSIDLFGKRKASHDGLSSMCKECQKEYDKSRLRDPKRVAARLEYQKTKGKEKHNQACKRWLVNNTIKRAAHTLVGNAVKAGKLVKMPCEICGEAKSNAHHDDYAKPLDVRWLCDIHHCEWHQENGEGANAS
jgi:hypothetical protein